ncbi:MAG TPA: 30S ribosomal protein S2, partial [Caldilinea sp.]|nr:30S ribosomal protein S2 [Caldilinea sp.]
FIVDTNVEELAVSEANKVHIPILGMVDTNSNPELISHVIPTNDDAIRAIKLIVGAIADAAEEGMRIREVEMAETGQVSREDLAEMEQYLGPSVLAKLQSLDDEDFEAYEEDDAAVSDDAAVEEVEGEAAIDEVLGESAEAVEAELEEEALEEEVKDEAE